MSSKRNPPSQGLSCLSNSTISPLILSSDKPVFLNLKLFNLWNLINISFRIEKSLISGLKDKSISNKVSNAIGFLSNPAVIILSFSVDMLLLAKVRL